MYSTLLKIITIILLICSVYCKYNKQGIEEKEKEINNNKHCYKNLGGNVLAANSKAVITQPSQSQIICADNVCYTSGIEAITPPPEGPFPVEGASPFPDPNAFQVTRIFQQTEASISATSLHGRDSIVHVDLIPIISHNITLMLERYRSFFESTLFGKPTLTCRTFPFPSYIPEDEFPITVETSTISYNYSAYRRHECGSTIKFINVRSIPLDPYASHGVAYGPWIHTSLIVGENLEQSVERQAISVLERIEDILIEGKSDRSNIMSAEIYLSSWDDKSDFDKAWKKFFSKTIPPTRSIVGDTIFIRPEQSFAKVGIVVVAHTSSGYYGRDSRYIVPELFIEPPNIASTVIEYGPWVYTSGLYGTEDGADPETITVDAQREVVQIIKNIESAGSRVGADRGDLIFLDSHYIDSLINYSPFTLAVAESYNLTTYNLPVFVSNGAGGTILPGARYQINGIFYKTFNPELIPDGNDWSSTNTPLCIDTSIITCLPPNFIHSN